MAEPPPRPALLAPRALWSRKANSRLPLFCFAGFGRLNRRCGSCMPPRCRRTVSRQFCARYARCSALAGKLLAVVARTARAVGAHGPNETPFGHGRTLFRASEQITPSLLRDKPGFHSPREAGVQPLSRCNRNRRIDAAGSCAQAIAWERTGATTSSAAICRASHNRRGDQAGPYRAIFRRGGKKRTGGGGGTGGQLVPCLKPVALIAAILLSLAVRPRCYRQQNRRPV